MTKEERFWSSIDKTDGCWLWRGYVNQRGYGLRANDGGERRVHRYAWCLANGPVPVGKLVCHTCDVRNCVNPAHLFLGSAADNTRDMFRKGRDRWSRTRQEVHHDLV